MECHRAQLATLTYEVVVAMPGFISISKLASKACCSTLASKILKHLITVCVQSQHTAEVWQEVLIVTISDRVLT